MKKTFFTLVLLAIIGLSTANAQVGIGTADPDESSILDVVSTEKGFLPPRMSSVQRDAIASPAEGLTIYNTEQQCLNVYVGLGWRNLCAVVGANDIINPITGQIWMDRNLGATAVTQTPRSDYTDAADYITAEEASFGDFYQWGRAGDGHQLRANSCPDDCINGDNPDNRPDDGTDQGIWDGLFITRAFSDFNWYSNATSNNDLWDGVNSINNPCPTGYRIPSSAEWTAERQSWVLAPTNSTNSADGAFASVLKLPVAGIRSRSSGVINLEGGSGRYWSSTAFGTNSSSALSYTATGAILTGGNRSFGYSIRCIKD